MLGPEIVLSIKKVLIKRISTKLIEVLIIGGVEYIWLVADFA